MATEEIKKLSKTAWEQGLTRAEASSLLYSIVSNRCASLHNHRAHGKKFHLKEKNFIRIIVHVLAYMCTCHSYGLAQNYLMSGEKTYPRQKSKVLRGIDSFISSTLINQSLLHSYNTTVNVLFESSIKPLTNIYDISFLIDLNPKNLHNQLNRALRNQIGKGVFTLQMYFSSDKKNYPGMLDEHRDILNDLHFHPFINLKPQTDK